MGVMSSPIYNLSLSLNQIKLSNNLSGRNICLFSNSWIQSWFEMVCDLARNDGQMSHGLVGLHYHKSQLDHPQQTPLAWLHVQVLQFPLKCWHWQSYHLCSTFWELSLLDHKAYPFLRSPFLSNTTFCHHQWWKLFSIIWMQALQMVI